MARPRRGRGVALSATSVGRDAEQLGGEVHQPVLLRPDGAVAERHGPHPLHQREALAAAEALTEPGGVGGEPGLPLFLRAPARGAARRAARPQRSAGAGPRPPGRPASAPGRHRPAPAPAGRLLRAPIPPRSRCPRGTTVRPDRSASLVACHSRSRSRRRRAAAGTRRRPPPTTIAATMPSVRLTPVDDADDPLPLGAEDRAQQRDAAIPDRRSERHRHEGADGAQTDEPGKGRHHRADAGQETADEDAGDAEPEILALDDGERPGREQAAAGARWRRDAARSGGRRDTRAAAPSEVGEPGHEKHARPEWSRRGGRGTRPALRPRRRAPAGRRSRTRRAGPVPRRQPQAGGRPPTASRESISVPPAWRPRSRRDPRPSR